MKKSIFIISALLPFLFFCVSSVTADVKYASAESAYMRVISYDTPFYKTPYDDAPLFYLPYTYYVKVLDVGNDYAHIECYGDALIAALDGYVPKDKLFSDGLEVSSPYLSLTITTLQTAVLYSDETLTTPLQYIFADRRLQYYGAIDSSQGIIYYVSYNNRLGYVKEADVYPFSITNHPNELTFLTPDAPEEPEQSAPVTEDFFGLKATVFVCLFFAGIIALLVALKQKPGKNAAASYYDENDYE